VDKLSIIIPLGNAFNGLAMKERHENLLFALEHFYSKHEDTESIVVTQNYIFPSTPFSSTIHLCSPVFNKGWCINAGVKASKGETICIAESDMYGFQPYLNAVMTFMKQKNLQWCFGDTTAIFTTERQRKDIMEYGRCTGTLDKRPPVPDGYEGGFLMFNRKFFNSLGGCNEWFEELGCIDNELVLRAKSASGTYEAYPESAWHLWHPECKKHTRSMNLDLQITTKHHSLLFNAFLSLQTSGDLQCPLSKRFTFSEAWDGFIKNHCRTSKDMIQKSWERYIEENKVSTKEPVQ